MPPFLRHFVPACLLLTMAPAARAERLDGKTPAERGAAIVRYVASIRPAPKDETNPKASAPCYAARLVLGTDVPYALEKLNAAASQRLGMARDRIARKAAYDAAPDKSKLKRPGLRQGRARQHLLPRQAPHPAVHRGENPRLRGNV